MELKTKKRVENIMAIPKEIPQEMIDIKGGPYHKMILESGTLSRCLEIHKRITVDSWPIERTCIYFNVSSVWYRNQVMRNGPRWDVEIADQQRIQKNSSDFEDRFKRVLNTDDEWDVDAFYTVLFNSDLCKKVILNEEEEWVDCSPITDSDILSLKDAMIAEKIRVEEKHQLQKEGMK